MGYGSHCSGLDKPRKIGVAQLMAQYPIVQRPAQSESQGFVRPYYLIVPEFDATTDICTPVRTVKYPLRYSIYLDYILINGGSIRSTTVWLDPDGQPIESSDPYDATYQVSSLLGTLVYDGNGHWIGDLTSPAGGTIEVDAILASCVPSSGLLVTFGGAFKGTGIGYSGSVSALRPDTLWIGETWFDGLNSWGGEIADDYPDGLFAALPKIYQGVPNRYTVTGGTWNVDLLENPIATTPITRAASNPHSMFWTWQIPSYPTVLDPGEKGYARMTLANDLKMTIGTATGNKTGGYGSLESLDFFSPITYTQHALWPFTLVDELTSEVTITPDLSVYTT